MKPLALDRIAPIVFWLLVVTALASAFPPVEAARADIVHCPAVERPGLKILVDDLQKRDFPRVQRGLLIYELDNHLLQIRLEADSKIGSRTAAEDTTRWAAVHCPDRWPKTHHDWDEHAIRHLYEHSVAIEMWVWSGEDGSWPSVGYLLVPVQHLGSDEGTPGVIVVERKSKPGRSPKDWVKWFDEAGRLAAYTHAATGVHLMRSLKYDVARKHLCTAQAQLTTLTRQSGGLKDSALLNYISGLAEEIVVIARRDPNYKGALMLTEDRKCPLQSP